MFRHMRELLRCAGIFVVAASAHTAIIAQTPAGASQQPLTLEAAFARALDANPDIRAARLRRAIDLSGLGVAAERPNPEAHVEIEKETPKQAAKAYLERAGYIGS